MEFQKFIDNNSDYLTECKKHNIYVQKHSQKHLALIKYHPNKEYDFESHPWMRECRGLIVNTTTNKVICLPPVKSIQKEMEWFLQDGFQSQDFEIYIEGTMMNVFFHEGTWFVSTRSSIGGNNSWDGKMSFSKMFHETVPKDFYESLQKDHCYSFVLIHKNNRIVSPTNGGNRVYLVEQHKVGETGCERVQCEELEGIYDTMHITQDYLHNYQPENLYFSIKGFMIKQGGERYSWINPNYEYALSLKMNNNNKFMNYIELRQKELLKEYFQYFPEDTNEFNGYRETFNSIKQQLYDEYVSIFIRKEKSIKDIEYSLRPLVYELHKNYLETKEKISFQKVSDYMHKLPCKKIVFVSNHMNLN